MPDELLLRILQEAKLDPLQLSTVAKVSRQFNRVSASDDLWQHHTPHKLRRLVAAKRSAQEMHEGSVAFKAAFLHRMSARKPDIAKAYRESLVHPKSQIALEMLGIVPFYDWEECRYHDGETQRFAQHDYDFVKLFVERYPVTFNDTFIETHLRAGTTDFLQDPDIALAILRKSPGFLPLFCNEIRDSAAHVMASFAFGNPTLQYASDRLQDDTQLVSYAVWMHPHNYQYASYKQRSRHDLVKIGLSDVHKVLLRREFGLFNIPHEVLRDPQMALRALSAGMPYRMLPEPTHSLFDVVAAGIHRDHPGRINASIRDAITVQRSNDRHFMLPLVRAEPKAAMYIGNLLRCDLPFMREVMSIAPQTMAVAGYPAACDFEAVRMAITAHSRSGRFIRRADLLLRKNSMLQKLAFEHGASVADLDLDLAGAVKAWFVYMRGDYALDS